MRFVRELAKDRLPVIYLVLHAYEKLRPVFPLAHALQAVHQIGKRLREVGPQLQGLLIGDNRCVLPARIFVSAGKVSVGLRALGLQQGDVLVASDGLLDSTLQAVNVLAETAIVVFYRHVSKSWKMLT